MITKIGSSAADVIEAAKLIKNGELVAFPTETVYGLGGNALLPEASKMIYAVKGRPSDNPLIVHLYEWDEIYNVAVPNDAAKTLYEAFCPGPLTMILPKLPAVPDETTGGRNTVAIRFPIHPMARDLIRLAGVPIAAPSANVSKHVSPTDASHVFTDLNGRIPLILDGGPCDVGIESTIVDLTGETPTVLRPGKITKEEIAAVLGSAENFHGNIKEALAPGMKYKHYSPSKPCYLAASNEIVAKAKVLTEEGKSVVAICRECLAKQIPGSISLGENASEAENRIYGALRSAEKGDIILVEDLNNDEAYFAVMNRINKSTGGNRI